MSMSINNPTNISISNEIKMKSPCLNISKIGIVSRNYNDKEDFSESFYDILQYLDSQGCDCALFSLFTLLAKNSLNLDILRFKYLRSIFIEEFEKKDNKRQATCYIVYYSENGNSWKSHPFTQMFGSISNKKPEYLKEFIDEEVPNKRIMGNALVLLCGESNIVKYNKKQIRVEDIYGILKKIPNNTNIILNPIHDRMTRFEMKKKREFLSENNRIVISVWNKGKTFKNDRIDNKSPAYTVFYNGKEKLIKKEHYISKNDPSIEVAIIETELIILK
ncbi:MAG: hypothetical protein FWG07_00090 [Treponema sp.]|nr:hypothetical protein [Treponema sp.]